jgi:ATP-binding cassette, subfamily C (CFTR/MRP), member 10
MTETDALLLQVFTTVALINMLIAPLNAFPWVLNGITEAWVSIKRIQKFLDVSFIHSDILTTLEI